MVYDNAAIRIRGPDAQPNFVIPPQFQKLEGAEVAVKREINLVVKSEASGCGCDSGDESHLPPPCCHSEATEAMRPNRRFLMNRREKVRLRQRRPKWKMCCGSGRARRVNQTEKVDLFVIPPKREKLEGAEVAVKPEINVVLKSEASGSGCDSGDESNLPPPCCNSEATAAMRPNRRRQANTSRK